MMKKINTTKGLLIFTGAIVLALSSCTKELPYEALPADKKAQTFEKSLIDTQSEYLYASSQQSSSMSASGAFPFFSGDNKRVRLQLTEKTLRVLEIERDQRYASNPNNDKLVLEIPISHVQFQCATDSFGECTNKEEDASKLSWNQKSNVKIEFESSKAGQLDFLPLLDSETFHEGCYKPVSSEVIYSSIEKDAINFQVKRTFTVDLYCIGDANTFAELQQNSSISAVYHYSFVKVDSVLSPNYKTISYPIGSKDEGSFGFFSTAKTKRDVDHSNTDKSLVQIMNRWNPERSEILYYLSDEFAKPQNKQIRDLTIKTVNNLNEGLKEAGVKFRINLKDAEGRLPGDIRHSMIVLVEDPTAASVIGYGPSTEDPVTGEVISARTIMFLGTIQNIVQYTYGDILRERQEAAALAATQAGKAVPKLTFSAQVDPKTRPMTNAEARIGTGKTYGLNLALEKKSFIQQAKDIEKVKSGNAQKLQSFGKITNHLKDIKNYVKVRNNDYIAKDGTPVEMWKAKVRHLKDVKNCSLSAESKAISSTISPKLIDKLKGFTKPWVELSASEKQKVMDIILPETWVPTLIHELGHNLGLRHNFNGSEDADNFYSDEELAARNIDRKTPFSSVMEYGDDLKALTVLGKYDIAALKFGYNREVEVVDAAGTVKLVPVETTLQDLKLQAGTALKNYGYCTDEHTGINAGCKRFDLGTTYTEITQNIIKDYENAYSTRNFRNGRADMSLWGDFAYAARIGRIFKDLRIMMEVRERIKYLCGNGNCGAEVPVNGPFIPEGHAVWSTHPFLKDLNDASVLAGQALAKVLATPDTMCAVSRKSAPMQIVGLVNLQQFAPGYISCFGLPLGGDYMVIAQAGKMFNSVKDNNSTNSYVDQIDVRGYWIDKVQAANALFKRSTQLYAYERYPISNFEKHNDSFLNVNNVGDLLLDLVPSIMFDNVVDNVEFTLIDGSKAAIQIPYDMSETQIIDKHLFAPIANILGINTNGPTRLQQVLAGLVASEARDLTGNNLQDLSLRSAFSVHRFGEGALIPNIADALSFKLAETTYWATPSNVMAQDMISMMSLAQILDPVGPEKVEQILLAKQAGTAMPADATPAEQAVWQLNANILNAYLNGVIKPASYYVDSIQVLPTAR